MRFPPLNGVAWMRTHVRVCVCVYGEGQRGKSTLTLCAFNYKLTKLVGERVIGRLLTTRVHEVREWFNALCILI